MNLTSEEIKKYSKRILLSRFRILNNHGFYGILLMHMQFGIDTKCDTAYTDGYKINFSPNFLDELTNSELDFVMMHEILHIVLKHCFRGTKVDNETFNIACDIVVNSNILYSNNMNLSSITLSKYGVAMHTIKGKEGYLYTAEQVYEMLPKSPSKKSGKNQSDNNNSTNKENNNSAHSGGSFDDHTHWNLNENDEYIIDEWEQRLIQATEMISKREASTGVGKVPLGAARLVEKLTDSTVNWKEILNNFLSFEIGDYSFLPPDRRMSGPFFMPDFNELVENEDDPQDILFMVDTSGSISDKDISEAYSEIKGAIDQFPSLKGYLGFFDHEIYEPIPFESIDDLLKIRPYGGGGTNFHIIFKYVQRLEEKPKAIVILTDGYAAFPKEEERCNIPVIWIINNDKVTPPWGTIARIKREKK